MAHPDISGIKNYKNTPFDKVFIVEVFAGVASPAKDVKVQVFTDESAIKVGWGEHIAADFIGSGFMVAPPSIDTSKKGKEPQMTMGPYKSRRAAAIDAKTIVRQLLEAYAGGTNKDEAGTITELYELTDDLYPYVQKRAFPPSSPVGVVGLASGTPMVIQKPDHTMIVIGYIGQSEDGMPVYARVLTVEPNTKGKVASQARLQVKKGFIDSLKAMKVTAKQMKAAKDATKYDNSLPYPVYPKKNPRRGFRPPRASWSSNDAEFTGNPSKDRLLRVNGHHVCSLQELKNDNIEEFGSEVFDQMQHAAIGDVFSIADAEIEIIA